MDYKIMFIDEESTQHDDFLDHFEKYWPEVKPQCEFPSQTIDEMLEKIESYHPDAVVVDFQLNDKKEDIKYNVSYNGVELIKAICKEMLYFPCFVITSHDDDAVNDSDDVNLVYVKKNLHFSDEECGKVSFAQRVKSQVDKFHSKISSARTELSQLIKKRNEGNANIQDEERIIELDSFLEKIYGKQNSVPSQMKTLSNIDRLKTLIEKVDCLINKLD